MLETVCVLRTKFLPGTSIVVDSLSVIMNSFQSALWTLPQTYTGASHCGHSHCGHFLKIFYFPIVATFSTLPKNKWHVSNLRMSTFVDGFWLSMIIWISQRGVKSPWKLYIDQCKASKTCRLFHTGGDQRGWIGPTGIFRSSPKHKFSGKYYALLVYLV